MHATVMVQDAGRAAHIEAALKKTGASVWQTLVLSNKRTSLSVSDGFNWTTLEIINKVLNQARQAEGVVMEENHLHCNKREGAVRVIERKREPQQREQGLLIQGN